MKLVYWHRRLNDALAALIIGASGLIVAFMVVALFGGAVTRYFTGIGYDWVLEFPPITVPWLVFPMAAVLLRHGSHIAVDVLPPLLTPRKRRVVYVLADLVLLTGGVVFFIGGLDAVALFRMMGQLTEMEVQFPIWYIYLAFPVGFAIFISFALENLLHDLLEPVTVPHEQHEHDTTMSMAE